jgi:TolA-binding protein
MWQVASDDVTKSNVVRGQTNPPANPFAIARPVEQQTNATLPADEPYPVVQQPVAAPQVQVASPTLSQPLPSSYPIVQPLQPSSPLSAIPVTVQPPVASRYQPPIANQPLVNQQPPNQPFPVQQIPAQPPVAASSEPKSIWDTVTPEQMEEFSPNFLPGHFAQPEAQKKPDGISLEEAKRLEDLAVEKERMLEAAREKQLSSVPKYLQPLPHYAGVLEERTRETKGRDELDIIQASHREQAGVLVASRATTADGKPLNNNYVVDPADLFDWEKAAPKGFDWDALDPAKLVTRIRDWAGFGPDEDKALALMKEGYAILNSDHDLKDKTKNLRAAKKFEQAAKRWPNSVIEEDALYLMGECYYFSDYYPKAMTCYQKLVINYHHSKHLDTSVRRLFAIGRYWEGMSRKAGGLTVNFTDKSLPANSYFANSKRAYETIFLHDTNGPVSDDAVMALATACMVRGQRPGDAAYDDAAHYFAFLREHYPNSKHAVRARELELYSLANTYHGTGYNTKSLDIVTNLADQTLVQHSQELTSEDKTEIVQLKESAMEKQAESKYETARFYQKRREYGAARRYYNEIIEKYPQSTQAENSQKQLESIADKPDNPGRFDWFTDLVNSSNKNSNKKEEK